jgi:hypothetical protein
MKDDKTKWNGGICMYVGEWRKGFEEWRTVDFLNLYYIVW